MILSKILFQNGKLSLQNTVLPTAEAQSYHISLHVVAQLIDSHQNYKVWCLEEFGLFFAVFHVPAWCHPENESYKHQNKNVCKCRFRSIELRKRLSYSLEIILILPAHIFAINLWSLLISSPFCRHKDDNFKDISANSVDIDKTQELHGFRRS